MVKHSKEEINLLAYLLRALGFPCTTQRLSSCLESGARHGLWDGCIELDEKTVLWIDYDGGYFHTTERVDHDAAKSVRKLAEDPRNRVLRIRASAVAMTAMPLCATPVTTATKPWEQLKEIRTAIIQLLPPSFATRLSSAHLQRDKVVDGIAHDVILATDKQYKREFTLVESELGKRAANAMLRVSNVKTLLRSGYLMAALQRLRTDLGLDTTQLVTFMCDGVASRLTDEGFIDTLQRLRTDLGLDTTQLVTFMCDGVASRLTDEGFIDALKGTGRTRKFVDAAIRAFPVKRRRS